jgi:hypothetical protein
MRLVILAMSMWAGVAAAEPTAKDLYDSGLRHYNLTEYDAALADFKKAYQLSGRPELLYNLAQCYRAMGDPTKAQAQYRAYLREKPDAANRAEVEKLILAMDTAIKAQKQPPTEASPPVTPTPAPAPPPVAAPGPEPSVAPAAVTATAPPPAEHRPVYKKGWFWGVMAGVAAVVVAGVTVGAVLGTQDNTRTLNDLRPVP